jgi:DNA-binding IscR family transcriptional regulator
MKSDFIVAVHGLVYLHHKGCITSSEELAKNICTNPARVRKVMAKMKAMGMVTTKEGHVGGYCPCPNLGKASLAVIAGGLDTVFVETKWHSGSEDNTKCLVCSGMAGIFDELYSKLDENCKKELSKITIQKIEKEIFNK